MLLIISSFTSSTLSRYVLFSIDITRSCINKYNAGTIQSPSDWVMPGDTEWCQVILSDARWYWVVPGDTEWCQVILLMPGDTVDARWYCWCQVILSWWWLSVWLILQVRESASTRPIMLFTSCSSHWINPWLLALIANCDNALNTYHHRRSTLESSSWCAKAVFVPQDEDLA